MSTQAINENAARMLQQAAGAMQAGQASEVVRLCRQVLEILPGQPDALHMLAMAAAGGGDNENAEKLFSEAHERAPQRPDILVNFGTFLKRQERLVDAGRQFEAAVNVAPDYAPAWHNLGLILHAVGNFDEALRCAKKLIELRPNDPAGWELLAAAEQKRGDAQAAIAACRKGLEFAPTAARLHYSLGQLLRQECEFDASAAAYAVALEHGYNTPDLYINRMDALSDGGDIDAALSWADQGLLHFPESAPLHRARAHLHWEAGRSGDPVDELRSAARSQPQNSALWYTLARLLDRLGRRDDSIAAVAEARQLGCPDSPELLMQEALCSAYGGDDAGATQRFDRLVKGYPGHLGAMLTFAQHLLTSGDPQRAEALCAQVLELDPVDQLAWCYRGTAWQLLGDERESWLMDYERMVRRVPIPPPEGYADTASFMVAVGEALEELHQTQAHPIEQSVRGGTQTNGFLFRLKHPLLAVLEQQIRLAIQTVLADFPDQPDHPFWGRKPQAPRGDGIRFSGAWSVRLSSEGYHTHHIHPEGWISSALYIGLPDEVKAGAGDAGHIQFGVPMSELGLDLPPRRTIQPRVGSLALFPSYMWHGTVPFTSEQPRITVAFDLQPQP